MGGFIKYNHDSSQHDSFFSFFEKYHHDRSQHDRFLKLFKVLIMTDYNMTAFGVSSDAKMTDGSMTAYF